MGEQRGEAVEDNQRQFFVAKFMGVNWFANGFVEDFCENYTGTIMIREVMTREIVEFHRKKKKKNRDHVLLWKAGELLPNEPWDEIVLPLTAWMTISGGKMGIWSTFAGQLGKLHLLMRITCSNQKLWNRTDNKLTVKWNNLLLNAWNIWKCKKAACSNSHYWFRKPYSSGSQNFGT